MPVLMACIMVGILITAVFVAMIDNILVCFEEEDEEDEQENMRRL